MTRPLLVLIAGGGVCLILALGAFALPSIPGDAATREWLLGLETSAFIGLLHVINHAGSGWLLVPATLLLYVAFPRARKRWWIWIALMLAAPAAESVLKFTVGRTRPEALSMGFPSGHATAAAAYFGAVFYLAQSLPPGARVLVRAGAVLTIVLVAIARVVLRAHWPTDAIGGLGLGLALVSAAVLLDEPERSTQAEQRGAPLQQG